MTPFTRRTFLKKGTAACGLALPFVAATAIAPRVARAAASDNLRLAVIGCGNQGSNHVRSLAQLPNSNTAYVCDVDETRLANAVKASGTAKPIGDFRRILDDTSIDGVTIATPDHWHVPVALMALDAGKHVYVEKPCSHNIREAKLLRDAARRTGKVVVHGTQSRSSPPIQHAIQLLREGVIGDVLQAKGWNIQRRNNIGHKSPTDPPPGVDYDTWVGPAEWLPFQANRFHYDWHWWHNFGCGDLGNDGIHEFDYALWGLGVDTLPTVVSAAGGKYFFDDDQEFPDTQQVTLEYGDKVGNRRMFVFEMKLWSTSYPYNVDSGVEYFGTKGKMFVSKRGKFEVRGDRNEPLDVKLDMPRQSNVPGNFQNWLDCIRSGSEPNANIDVAVRTTIAMHLANIATRLNRTIRFDPAKEQIIGDDEATALMSRKYRKDGYWGIPKGV